MRDLGLQGAKVKALDCPPVKISTKEVRQREDETALEPAQCTNYRSGVMRIAYLSLDRPDLAQTVKCLSRHMQKPTESDWADLKRVGRFTATDYAGDRVNRKSTTGAATFFGPHCLKTQSNLQTTVSLSSGEAEYYGIVKVMSMGFSMKSLLADFGITVGTLVKESMKEGIEIFSDSSAARAFAQRKGLGRQKHVH
eukprot:1809486-Amphidinium_carterae.1